MKRLFDVIFSILGLFFLAPVIAIFCFLVFIGDWHSPFYVAPRVGKDGKSFRMVKLRSMVVNADASGVDSTSSDDKRITAVGHMIRRFKLDELMQLWNVLVGDMSLVGPRPNVERDVARYTETEKNLLSVRPGITDYSSIVFSDEGNILEGSEDPDLLYNQVIRPWKSRLGLHYILVVSLFVDVKIIVYTVLAIVSKSRALRFVVRDLTLQGADPEVIRTCTRNTPLAAFPPPGGEEIVVDR
jgi:lipopolysaccharide/colanic/teichoic acid biosynthesis glycosyltransferase